MYYYTLQYGWDQVRKHSEFKFSRNDYQIVSHSFWTTEPFCPKLGMTMYVSLQTRWHVKSPGCCQQGLDSLWPNLVCRHISRWSLVSKVWFMTFKVKVTVRFDFSNDYCSIYSELLNFLQPNLVLYSVEELGLLSEGQGHNEDLNPWTNVCEKIKYVAIIINCNLCKLRIGSFKGIWFWLKDKFKILIRKDQICCIDNTLYYYIGMFWHQAN